MSLTRSLNLGGEVNVSNLGLHIHGDHDVGEGEISVHDLVTVEILHRAEMT